MRKIAGILFSLLSLTVPVSAKVIAVFPGNEYIFPILLTDDLCVPGKPDAGFRALMVAVTHYAPKGRRIEACWNYDSAKGNGKDVIITCLTKDGKRNGLVSGDCRWIDKYYFLNPSSLPRSAF